VNPWWWTRDDPAARAVRAALWPAAALYGVVAGARARRHDRGVARAHDLGLPAVAVGNLTAGGTGKTPVAAWLAGRLRDAGHTPAVLLRGYGADEVLVHRHLTPGAVVVADADRAGGARTARAQGATVAVLDDAFQHRQARRDVDVVLVSADAWPVTRLPLPSGPWREPLSALRRAHVAVVTCKAAAPDVVARVRAAVVAAAPEVPLVDLGLVPGALVTWLGDDTAPLSALDGAAVLAVSAVADPAAFERQLAALGARVTAARFRDHHAFTADEVTALAGRAAALGRVVCTLKDAVKLGPRWPRGGVPLWYVTQRVVPGTGADALDRVLARLGAPPHPRP
jgi:tetraacyldisaccharide 4'-kinase